MTTREWLPALALTWGILPVVGGLMLAPALPWGPETAGGVTLTILAVFIITAWYLGGTDRILEKAAREARGKVEIRGPHPSAHTIVAVACVGAYVALLTQVRIEPAWLGFAGAAVTTFISVLVLWVGVDRLGQAGVFGSHGAPKGAVAAR